MKNDDIVKEGNENAKQKVTTLHYNTSIDDSAERHPATKFSVFFTKTLVRHKKLAHSPHQ